MHPSKQAQFEALGFRVSAVLDLWGLLLRG